MLLEEKIITRRLKNWCAVRWPSPNLFTGDLFSLGFILLSYSVSNYWQVFVGRVSVFICHDCVNRC